MLKWDFTFLWLHLLQHEKVVQPVTILLTMYYVFSLPNLVPSTKNESSWISGIRDNTNFWSIYVLSITGKFILTLCLRVVFRKFLDVAKCVFFVYSFSHFSTAFQTFSFCAVSLNAIVLSGVLDFFFILNVNNLFHRYICFCFT